MPLCAEGETELSKSRQPPDGAFQRALSRADLFFECGTAENRGRGARPAASRSAAHRGLFAARSRKDQAWRFLKTCPRKTAPRFRSECSWAILPMSTTRPTPSFATAAFCISSPYPGFISARRPRRLRFCCGGFRCLFFARGLLSVLVIGFYVLVCGASPSAQRAAILFSIMTFAPTVRRKADGLCSLAAAAIVILSFDPLAVFSAGFRLSFAAAGTIVLIGRDVSRVPDARPSKDPSAVCKSGGD